LEFALTSDDDLHSLGILKQRQERLTSVYPSQASRVTYLDPIAGWTFCDDIYDRR
jgi:hypothetical protein